MELRTGRVRREAWPPWRTETVHVTQVIVEKRNMAGGTGKGGVQYYRRSII